jgi:hypothetical protein
MVTAIAKKMGIEEAHHPEIDELSQDVKPEIVMNKIEHEENKVNPPSFFDRS